MSSHKDAALRVMKAAQGFGLSSILFRNATGRKLGLNITDSESLSLIAIKGASTPTQLAKHTGLTTGSITALLDRLEKIGFIKRKPNPDDRRGVLVEIDPRYQMQAGPLVADMQAAHWKLFEQYTETELETIADLLTKFTANVTAQTEKVETL